LKQTGTATVRDEGCLSNKTVGTVVTGHIFGVDIMLLKPLISLPITANSKYRQTCHNFFPQINNSRGGMFLGIAVEFPLAMARV
jgi:hypothetical protein